MRSTTLASAALMSLLLVPLSGSGQSLDTHTIVFVCEHGSAKSVIAASLFNRAAEERGLPYRSVARGLNPDAQVPTRISAALRADGFDVETFLPERVADKEVTTAARVVGIGIDSASLAKPARNIENVNVETWNDVPSPIDYAASRAAIQRHIDTLLKSLPVAVTGQNRSPPP